MRWDSVKFTSNWQTAVYTRPKREQRQPSLAALSSDSPFHLWPHFLPLSSYPVTPSLDGSSSLKERGRKEPPQGAGETGDGNTHIARNNQGALRRKAW